MRISILSLAALLASPMLCPAVAQAAPATQTNIQPSRFSVVVQGSGPDVILIPGLSSTRDVWAATAAQLRTSHRVHLVQLKGFGEPAGVNGTGPVLAPFVEELAGYIHSNGLKKPAIIGHSMGGLAALMVAADHPALPGKLLIVDAFPFIGPVFGAADVASVTPRAEQLRKMLLANASKVTPDFQTSANCDPAASAPAPVTGNMTNSALGQCLMTYGAKSSDLRVVAQAMYDDMVTDMTPRLKDIAAPVTVLYPQDDRLITAPAAAKLYADSYAGTPKVQLRRIAGSYHFIMQDQPAAFAAAVDEFLRN